jgi:hypothetical protein
MPWTLGQQSCEVIHILVLECYLTNSLATERSREQAPKHLPDLLTVEEAARLCRVGRTKAYLMAREWRATGGRSGLPVVEFGHVLRVPRQALERMIGAELRAPAPVTSDGGNDDRVGDRREREAVRPAQPPPTIRRSPIKTRRRNRATANGQLNLFSSTD